MEKYQYLKSKTVADHLNLSQRSICRLCESGELPAIKVGGTWLIHADTYRQYIEAKKNDSIEIFLTTLEAKTKKNASDKSALRR